MPQTNGVQCIQFHHTQLLCLFSIKQMYDIFNKPIQWLIALLSFSPLLFADTRMSLQGTESNRNDCIFNVWNKCDTDKNVKGKKRMFDSLLVFCLLLANNLMR